MKVVLLGVALAAGVLPASAQEEPSQDLLRCENEEKKLPVDDQIAACKAVIQSGKPSSVAFSVAFFQLG